jgi:RNA polymerase sigma-70 factor (ECF subfamily)
MHYSFDDVYLDALKRHDPATEDHFVCCFSRALKASLRRRFRSTQVIEDATQETLFRVLTYFRAGKTLRAAGNLPAFVISVCTNVSREMLRATAHYEQLAENFDDTVDVRANPERAAMEAERSRMVRRTLGELTRKDQCVLTSVFLDEADKDQVCRELRTNRDHLRVVLYRARVRFRKAAEQRENSPTPEGKNVGTPRNGNRVEITF